MGDALSTVPDLVLDKICGLQWFIPSKRKQWIVAGLMAGFALSAFATAILMIWKATRCAFKRKRYFWTVKLVRWSWCPIPVPIINAVPWLIAACLIESTLLQIGAWGLIATESMTNVQCIQRSILPIEVAAQTLQGGATFAALWMYMCYSIAAFGCSRTAMRRADEQAYKWWKHPVLIWIGTTAFPIFDLCLVSYAAQITNHAPIAVRNILFDWKDSDSPKLGRLLSSLTAFQKKTEGGIRTPTFIFILTALLWTTLGIGLALFNLPIIRSVTYKVKSAGYVPDFAPAMLPDVQVYREDQAQLSRHQVKILWRSIYLAWIRLVAFEILALGRGSIAVAGAIGLSGLDFALVNSFVGSGLLVLTCLVQAYIMANHEDYSAKSGHADVIVAPWEAQAIADEHFRIVDLHLLLFARLFAQQEAANTVDPRVMAEMKRMELRLANLGPPENQSKNVLTNKASNTTMTATNGVVNPAKNQSLSTLFGTKMPTAAGLGLGLGIQQPLTLDNEEASTSLINLSVKGEDDSESAASQSSDKEWLK